jgi:hypothetical protein
MLGLKNVLRPTCSCPIGQLAFLIFRLFVAQSILVLVVVWVSNCHCPNCQSGTNLILVAQGFQQIKGHVVM